MTNDAKMLLNDSKTSERYSVTRRGKQKFPTVAQKLATVAFMFSKYPKKLINIWSTTVIKFWA